MSDSSSAADLTTTEIDVEVADKVMTITLDRPANLNAFTVTMLREIHAALDVADADDDVRAVIFTGNGRAFCAGADLSAGAETFEYKREVSAVKGEAGGEVPDARSRDVASMESEGALVGPDGEIRDGGGILTLRIFKCRKPVIAAINGAAVGVGATMTLPMDIRLAAEGARFGFVFNARGIVPEACSSWFLPRVVGINTALEWCYTARLVPAVEAQAAGLVRSIHPPDQLLEAARELAAEIVAGSAPVSVALTRMMLWRMLGEAHPMAAHRVDSRAVNYTGRMPDAREGIMAFFEKRPANWSMKVSEDLPPFVPWWEEPRFE